MALAITGLLILIFSIAFIVAPHLLYRIVNWLQKRSLTEISYITLTLLIILASVRYLPFTYQGELGDADAYHMVSGYLDSINSGTPFVSQFLYKLHNSFGYYAWLYLFSDFVQARPPFLISLMNYSNAIAAVLMVVPFFFVVRRYWGLGTAVSANLILMLIPVWWQVSRFGQPQLTAILFMFTGLALLCYRSHLASEHQSKAKIFACDILATAALSFCLMNRLDAILMFPLILACLLLERYSLKTATYRFVAYSFLPLLIRFAVRAFLPADVFVDAYGGSVSFLDFLGPLLHHHNPARIIEQFGRANRIFAACYPPILLLIFIMACLYLARTRKYLSLFFVLPVVIINYLFWLPNPWSGRHFIYLSPTLSIGIALILSSIADHASSFITSKKLVTHAVIILVFLFAYFSVSILDGIGSYNNPYSPEGAHRASRFGQDLQKFPSLNKPLFVIAYPYPIIAKMMLETDSITITRELPHFKFVNNGKNNFIFYSRDMSSQEFWVALRKKTEKYDEFYWLVDPYNQNGPWVRKYIKSFNIEAPSSAKQLDVQSLIRQRSSSIVGESQEGNK